jgi:glutamyl-tRNA reductase
MTSASLLVAGLSHRTAPVELLGRCVLCGPGAVAALRDRDEIPEVVALSTCNRRELYAVARDPWAARESMAQALADMTGLGLPELWRSLYIHHEEQAARHLFRVVSSLDSMVLGESEIQGQVRRAWESAHTDGASGPMLDRLFRRALQVGRRVRRDTRIGAGRVSVPSVAVGLVERAVGSLTDRRVLVVGAGEMARVVADALAARRVPDVVVVSRSREAAAAVAGPRGWRSAALTALGHEIPPADVVISAAAAPHILVTRGDVERAMCSRPGRPMALIDMAVPCDIDPGAAAVAGVTLHTMEDIHGVAAASSVERLAQADLAEGLIAHEVERFGAVRAQRRLPSPAVASR